MNYVDDIFSCVYNNHITCVKNIIEERDITVDFLMSGRSPKAETCLADGSDYSSGSELVELSEKEIAFIVKLRSLSQEDRDEIMNFMEWKKSQSSAGAK